MVDVGLEPLSPELRKEHNMKEITFFMRVHSIREVRGETRPETSDPWPQEWEVRADTNEPLVASLFYRTNQVDNLPRPDSTLRVVVGPHEAPLPPQSSDQLVTG